MTDGQLAVAALGLFASGWMLAGIALAGLLRDRRRRTSARPRRGR